MVDRKSLSTRLISAVIWAVLLGSAMSPAQDSAASQAIPNETQRKVTNRVMPSYPELARKTNVTGTVRAEALVTADGRVKSVVMKGGNPVLIQAAEHAIYKWKWAPAKHETQETIEVRFDPAD
jgi:TonB family protein